MNRRSRIFAILTLVFMTQNGPAAPLRKVCALGRATGQEAGGRAFPPWKFCAYEYPDSSRSVLYYFHGIGGSEHDWELHELERGIVSRWQALGIRPPIVVSISFGPVWLLTERTAGPKGGLFEFVRDQAIPEIRSRVLGFAPEQNWLMGVSMGGFNASQFYFKDPRFFTRAAILCGAMTQVSPFDSPYTVENYIRRTRAVAAAVWTAVLIMKSYLPSPAAWLAHSPIELARARFSAMSPPLFVANGTADEFGFHEGNIDFARWARERGVASESHFYPGRGHCQIEANPVADFLGRYQFPFSDASHPKKETGTSLNEGRVYGL